MKKAPRIQVYLDDESNAITKELQQETGIKTKSKAVQFIVKDYTNKARQLIQAQEEIEQLQHKITEFKTHRSAYQKAHSFFMKTSEK